MAPDAFARYSGVLHQLTLDFVRAVPEGRWAFTPDPARGHDEAQVPHRPGKGFAPFNKQLRHVVCVRGVYNAALANGAVDWDRKHRHYDGPLTRDPLVAALQGHQDTLLSMLRQVDTSRTIDWGGTPFTFADFTWEWVQHEAIHHGQWSLYASLGGFETPVSWRTSWGL